MADLVTPHRERLLTAAERRGIHHIRVFGSVRRSEAGSRSDVDLLVAPDPGTSAYDLIGFQIDAEKILRRTVEVLTDESVHWLIRPQVLFEAAQI